MCELLTDNPSLKSKVAQRSQRVFWPFKFLFLKTGVKKVIMTGYMI